MSDVHCDAVALRAALEAMGDVDEVLCAGDLVFDFRFSNEVLDIVRERGIRHVIGNHDAGVLSQAAERLRASGQCDPGHLDHLRSTPEELRLRIGGKEIYMVHGSPWDRLHEYIYPGSPKISTLGDLGADYVVLGHTHYSMVETAGAAIVINPGSVGDPRDRRNGRRPTYAVLELETGDCAIHTVEL